MNAIDFLDVSKNYGKMKALDHVSFSVKKGTITALIGPNGAGKTTAMKVMKRLMPFSGTVKIKDCATSSIDEKTLIKELFYLPEEKALPQTIRVKDLIQELHWLGTGLDFIAINRLVDEFDLRKKWNERIRDLSMGMKSSLFLVQALSSPADLLILDEPLSGLDSILRGRIIDLLKERVLSGEKTVLYSSHILDEVAEAADEMLVVNSGRCLFQGPIDEAKERYSEFVIEGLADIQAIQSIPGVLYIIKGENKIVKCLIDNTLLKEKLPGKRFNLTLKEIFHYLIAMDREQRKPGLSKEKI